MNYAAIPDSTVHSPVSGLHNTLQPSSRSTGTRLAWRWGHSLALATAHLQLVTRQYTFIRVARAEARAPRAGLVSSIRAGAMAGATAHVPGGSSRDRSEHE